jgi:hypothetical protein
MYRGYDSYTFARLLAVNVQQVENHWTQWHDVFSQASLGRRLDYTEVSLAAEMHLAYELDFMSFDSTDISTHVRADGWAMPRVLVGPHTNGDRNVQSASNPTLEFCSLEVSIA